MQKLYLLIPCLVHYKRKRTRRSKTFERGDYIIYISKAFSVEKILLFTTFLYITTKEEREAKPSDKRKKAFHLFYLSNTIYFHTDF